MGRLPARKTRPLETNLTALGGAVTIAFASAVVFLLIVRSWTAFVRSSGTTRFPNSIMLEAAQRFRDEHERLGQEQSVYLLSALIFTVVFTVFYLLPPDAMFDQVPRWQLIVVLVMLLGGVVYMIYRLASIVIARRRLLFVKDANMATGHALQKLTSNRNRVFHDVPCGESTIDNVIVGLQGVYTVSVVARQPGKLRQVRLRDESLCFAGAKEPIPVTRSGKKSALLARDIRKVTGHEIRVRSVICVPGWEIDMQESNQYLLVNERNLAMLTGWRDRDDHLMNEDVEAIHKMLTKRCTRFGNR